MWLRRRGLPMAMGLVSALGNRCRESREVVRSVVRSQRKLVAGSAHIVGGGRLEATKDVSMASSWPRPAPFRIWHFRVGYRMGQGLRREARSLPARPMCYCGRRREKCIWRMCIDRAHGDGSCGLVLSLYRFPPQLRGDVWLICSRCWSRSLSLVTGRVLRIVYVKRGVEGGLHEKARGNRRSSWSCSQGIGP